MSEWILNCSTIVFIAAFVVCVVVAIVSGTVIVVPVDAPVVVASVEAVAVDVVVVVMTNPEMNFVYSTFDTR